MSTQAIPRPAAANPVLALSLPMSRPQEAPPKNMASSSPALPDHLSHSQCRTYAGCPLQWFFSRRFAPEFVPANLVFGSSFHASVEAYYQARLEGRAVTSDDLLAAFTTHWADELAGKHGHVSAPVKFTAKEEDEAALQALAARMFAAFLEHQQQHPSEVIAIEEGFRIELGPDLPPLVGKIDLVEVRVDADGVRRLHLVDWKTAARTPTLDDLGTDQLHLYGMAMRGLGLVSAFKLPLALRFDVCTKTKQPAIFSLTVESSSWDTRRLTEKIRQCWRGMEAGIFYPAPSWRCGGCGHAKRCAAWPRQLPVPKPAAVSA